MVGSGFHRLHVATSGLTPRIATGCDDLATLPLQFADEAHAQHRSMATHGHRFTISSQHHSARIGAVFDDVFPQAHPGEIRVCAEADGIRVRLCGDLDHESGLLLADAIVAAADAIEPLQRIDVDLREVERLTPAGVHALATSTSRAQARDRRVRIQFRRGHTSRSAPLLPL